MILFQYSGDNQNVNKNYQKRDHIHYLVMVSVVTMAIPGVPPSLVVAK